MCQINKIPNSYNRSTKANWQLFNKGLKWGLLSITFSRQTTANFWCLTQKLFIKWRWNRSNCGTPISGYSLSSLKDSNFRNFLCEGSNLSLWIWWWRGFHAKRHTFLVFFLALNFANVSIQNVCIKTLRKIVYLKLLVYSYWSINGFFKSLSLLFKKMLQKIVDFPLRNIPGKIMESGFCDL